jgi:Domain of unknown function (DUF4178)
MLSINCPACGAPVNFRSKSSVFAVCEFCKSTLVRHDMNLQALGKMAELQDDMSPLQIGTSGTFEGRGFELVGRVKVGYEDGSWNEWYALFFDNTEGWLAEAQGFYAVCFPLEVSELPETNVMYVGNRVDLGSAGAFQIVDVRTVNCVFSQGELPLQASQGRKSLSIDLCNADGEMATIEYADTGSRVFVGAYQEFDQFQFKNARRFDGW